LVSGRGSKEEITADFARAVSLAPDSFDAVLQWAYWLRDSGRRAEAERAFRKAMDLNPQSASPVMELMSVLCASGNVAQAEDLLHQFRERSRDPREVQRLERHLLLCLGEV
jgi:pentatricopeptide repeat protein